MEHQKHPSLQDNQNQHTELQGITIHKPADHQAVEIPAASTKLLIAKTGSTQLTGYGHSLNTIDNTIPTTMGHEPNLLQTQQYSGTQFSTAIKVRTHEQLDYKISFSHISWKSPPTSF